MPVPLDSFGKSIMLFVCPSTAFVYLFDLVATISHEQFEQSRWTYSECPLAPTDDVIRFWRSKMKVTAGRRDSEGIQIDASRVHLLVLY